MSPTTSPDVTIAVATVLFRLDGPMQAWSRAPRSHGGGGRRPTQDHPTKTGVVGLVANCLGLAREDPIEHLAALRYAVRADRGGVRATDFHTVGDSAATPNGGAMPVLPGTILNTPGWVEKAARLPDGHIPVWSDFGTHYAPPKMVTTDRQGRLVSTNKRAVAPSTDEYLADACFTGALTGPPPLVTDIAAALDRPARQPHLGRVAYPTVGRLLLDVTNDTDPVAALHVAPLADRHDERPRGWPIWFDALTDGRLVNDQPVSYAARTTSLRREARTYFNPTGAASNDPAPGPTSAPAGVDFFTQEGTQ